jgi:hypothetical protein
MSDPLQVLGFRCWWAVASGTTPTTSPPATGAAI